MSFFEPVSLGETRSLIIFAGYLIFSASLSAFLVYSLFVSYAAQSRMSRSVPSRTRLLLFIVLAGASLATTWYYMLSFFLYSYRAFLRSSFPAFDGAHDPFSALPLLAKGFRMIGIESLPERKLKQLLAGTRTLGGTVLRLDLVARWLNHGSLFREAWEAACADPARFWSMQQIFGLTAIWSLFVGWQSRRHAIAFAPLFMLLGQLVAVSFAMNLFFVALALTPRTSERKRSTDDDHDKRDAGATPLTVAWLAVLATWAATPLLLGTAESAWFPLVLAIPHVLLFAPTFGLRGSSIAVWQLIQTAAVLTAISQCLGYIFVLFRPEISLWWSEFALSLQREWALQTRLSGVLLRAGRPGLHAFARQPLGVQLETVLEPFFAPALSVLNVVEPLLSNSLVWTIDSISAGIQEFIADPLVVVSFVTQLYAFIMERSRDATQAVWSHPAATSVTLDAAFAHVSIAAWLLTGLWQGESLYEAVMGGS